MLQKYVLDRPLPVQMTNLLLTELHAQITMFAPLEMLAKEVIVLDMDHAFVEMELFLHL
jgi:hypothetical protein